MTRVLKPLAALGAFGLAAALFVLFVLPAIRGEARGVPPAPEPPAVRGLSAAERSRLLQAPDLVACGLIRAALDRHRGTAGEEELGALLEERGKRALENLEREVNDLAAAYRYESAVLQVERYRNAWLGTDAAGAMTRLLEELRAEQGDQLESRRQESDAYLADGRYDAAREALRSGMELEEEFVSRLADMQESLERRIRVHRYYAEKGSQPPASIGDRPAPGPTTRGELPPPPPLPGLPHPDVKRLAEARALMRQARELFRDGRFAPAAEALENLLGYFGDLAYVKRRQESVQALGMLAAHGSRGVAGLFHAARAEKKGSRVRLLYEFSSDAELLDWEALATIPHKQSGEFRSVREGVLGTGVMTYLHRAFFENGVEIRCVARPAESKSFGLAFCQNELESRQLLWLVCNHWFVEGENYVKERPGHSILMIGKGVNADVPVDSPEVGFIFRGGTIRDPQPRAGEEVKLSFEWKDEQMAGALVYRGESGGRRGSAVGDDGRGIERVRPGLFVVENRVVFSEVVLEGRLHPSFEQTRVRDLLSLVEGLD